MSDEQTPEWWGEVIAAEIRSKADARRIIRLCREGELQETWKPQWSTYLTAKGRIRLADFERAQDILTGTANPDPGRRAQHDWLLVNALVVKAARQQEGALNKAAIGREVAIKYKNQTGLTISSESASFKMKVRTWLGEMERRKEIQPQ